jgi:nicotinamidase-related amidase
VDDLTTEDPTTDAPTPTPRDALVLIDLQEDFLSAPGLQEQRAELVAGVRRWLDLARAVDALVLEVRTVVPEDQSTWALNMRADQQPVALEGTPGAERVAELADVEAVSVVKRRDDAFLGTDLVRTLEEHGVERIVVAGVSTQACVAMTAASAYAHDLRVSLAGGAVASEDARKHDDALRWLEDEYRQPLADPDDGWPDDDR